jgi:damage-control phosphatase, subfamily I
LGWKDEYAMGWRVVLTEDNTVCMSEGARHGRTRIGAFHSKPLSFFKPTRIDTTLNNVAYSPKITYNHTMIVQDCCLPCLKGLAEKTVTLSGGNGNLISECSHLIEQLWEPDATPPAISNKVLKHIKHKTGTLDPYKSIKTREFEEAMRAFQDVRPRFGDSLEAAVQLSALGNSMDFFVSGQYHLNNFNFVGTMDKIENTIYIKGKDVLMIGDNTGDFIFDMPLVEYLEKNGKEVYYAVRERPVQNDLCMEDVDRFGLHKTFGRIISTGTDEVGMKNEDLSGTVKALWESDSVVIAKGMGNYETISGFHNERPVICIMKVKCPAVAQAVRQDEGTYIALTGGE